MYDKHPIARKEHLCMLCEGKIQVGEKYIRRVGTRMRELISFAMHIFCEGYTHNWDDGDWICYDAPDFRRETLKDFT